MTAAEHADNFVGRYNGVYIDEDGSFGSQCWDVVARYAREEYGCTPFRTVSGGAEGLWRFYADPIPQYFDKVPASDLKKGDICVWNADFYPPYGHTSLVWAREGNTIWSFEQDGSNDPNGDGNADGVAYLAQRLITSKVAGGLRPKGGSSNMITKDILNSVYGAYYGAMPTQSDYDNWVGKDELANLIFQAERDPRRKNYFDSVQMGFAALRSQGDGVTLKPGKYIVQ